MFDERFMCFASCLGADKSDTSVYEEAIEMVLAASVVYIGADLRDMARNGQLGEGSMSLFQLPMSSSEMMKAIEDNQSHLLASGAYPNLDKQIETLNQISFHSTSGQGMLASILGNSQKQTNVVTFDDKNAHKEMVHAITVNDFRKRITIIIRGSVTMNDFMTDVKMNHKEIKNPVFKIDEKAPETINVHAGFYEYISKINKETGKSKIDTILEDVIELQKQNPDYSLYFTGHSLGGALSTLVGFYAAADEKISKLRSAPVRVVSVASPYVGGARFFLSFQSLERKNRIQHLRIANAEDTVTLLPMVSASLGAFSPVFAMRYGTGEVYKHCGIRLRFNADDQKNIQFTLTYEKDHKCDKSYGKEVEDFLEDGQNLLKATKLIFSKQADKVLNYHSCDEYEARIQKCKEELVKFTINGLYENKEIVGDVLNVDYEPYVMQTLTERVDRIMKSNSIRSNVSNFFQRGSLEKVSKSP